MLGSSPRHHLGKTYFDEESFTFLLVTSIRAPWYCCNHTCHREASTADAAPATQFLDTTSSQYDCQAYIAAVSSIFQERM